VNIFSLLNFDKKKINIKIVLVLLSFIIFIFLSIIIPNTSKVKMIDFLPEDSSFYYHWTNKDSFFNSFNNPFLDKQVSQEKIDNLDNIFNESFDNAQEIIWFRVNNSKEDHFLVLFSRLPYNFFDELNSDKYLFKRLDKRIVLVTKSKELLGNISLLSDSKFKINDFNSGINIYWQFDTAEDILSNTFPLLSSKNTFVNISEKKNKQVINIFQKNNEEFIKKDISLLQIPKDFDSIIGFSSSSTINFSNFVYNNILLSQFYSLPIYYSNDEELKDYFLRDNIIIQDENNYLVINKYNKYDLTNFFTSFSLTEVKKTLLDGTLYTELVFNEEEKKINHSFKEYNYWQMDNLFGIELNGYNYLSNRQYLIEDMLSDYIYLDELWKEYINNEGSVEDFVYLKTNKLPDGELKEYLKENSINSLDILSYTNNISKGYIIIF